MTDARMIVIYDGDCPFCRSYVRLMALRKRVGAVDLINARSDDGCVKEARDKGYDLNEGMLAIYGDGIYYGSDALALISTLSSNDNFAQRVLSRILANPARARFLYPLMKAGRRIILLILGKPKIL
jgi:predicted DCC family thiol-disulfide oxidoreductase YuxK